MAWRSGLRGAPPRRLLRSPDFSCERSCAHLTGVVKSNSSGIEVSSGSLRSREFLIEERWILGIHLNMD
jgi:hypothetical protein